MQYKIEKSNYNNFKVFRENTLSYRSYFIPFRNKSSAELADLFNERYSSDIVRVLSGEWDFRYYEKAGEIPEDFDAEKIIFDSINVPSCWQRIGYEPPVYVNSRYLFPCTPPDVPESSAGVYRKIVNLEKVCKSEILTFLGVSGGYSLYVNGKYVGYAEGSHNTAEFEISDFLTEGENEILVVLFKWCTGTYLECQDMFREAGIFRDVLLTSNDSGYIYDLEISNCKINGNWQSKVSVSVKNTEKSKFSVEIYDGKKLMASKSGESTDNVVFDLRDIEEWNAENPKLYTYFISLLVDGTETQTVRQMVGFKQIAVKGNVYTWNNAPIKLLGVNHHDTNPKTGYVMSIDEYKKDIVLMKELNVNCVRTSHYPPDPVMLIMCDYYGIYVVDEADIETHGAHAVNIDMISDNLAWKEHYLDRVKAMYYRDRNRVSVCMWSLGNESGGIKCHDYCYEYLKTVTSIPVHYEGACRSARKYYDIYSEMYTFPNTLGVAIKRKTDEKKRINVKPYFLCEYCHSMGVGPGSFEDYMDIFLNNDNMLGGCVWEWADHAVFHENGKYKYTYGGDHGEKIHDGNFCCDGLVYPDRTLSVSALSMKNAYRPVRASLIRDGLKFTNTLYFTDTKNLRADIEIVKDGICIEHFSTNLNILPQHSINTAVDWSKYFGDVYCNISYVREDNEQNIGGECLEISKSVKSSKDLKFVKITRSKNGYIAESNNAKIYFDRAGGVSDYVLNGLSLMDKTEPLTLEYQIYRAPIDNYMNYDKFCRAIGMHKAKAKSGRCRLVRGKLVINTYIRLRGNIIGAKIEVNVTENGEIVYSITSRTCFAIPMSVPKIGVKFTLPEKFRNIEYYGYGDWENYCDMLNHVKMGIYNQTTDDFFTDYIKPQDNGNRCGVRFAKITDGNGCGIKLTALDDALNFKADNINADSLMNGKHIEDVVKENKTNVYVSGYVRGAGSNSCGPDVMKKYMIKFGPLHKFKYTFMLKPFKND